VHPIASLVVSRMYMVYTYAIHIVALIKASHICHSMSVKIIVSFQELLCLFNFLIMLTWVYCVSI